MPENQTQPNNSSYANPSGEPRIDPNGAPAQGEGRTFSDRHSDLEAAHDSQEGDSVRTAQGGTIGGDMGRDESKGQTTGRDPNEPGGEMEHQDPAHADDLAKVQEGGSGGDFGGGGSSASAGDLSDAQVADQQSNATAAGHTGGSSFAPSQVEATRARMQGGGVGQREMDLQRDPTGADSTDHYGQMGDQDGGRGRGNTDVEKS